MFGILGTSASFANAAGRGGKATDPKIVLTASNSDTAFVGISCTGTITIETIKNGVKQQVQYTDLEDSGDVALQSDPNTPITIIGTVTQLNIDDKSITTFIVKNNVLNTLILRNNYLVDLDLRKAQLADELDIQYNEDLKVLKLPKDTVCTLAGNDNAAIEEIWCGSKDFDLADSVANLINNATTNSGVVYTDSTGAHYNTIATAATTKGWTIKEYPA